VGAVRVSHLGWRLPGGIELLRDVSFTVGDGERAALVGARLRAELDARPDPAELVLS